MTSIDLNCDLGEERGDDEAVLPFVTSANIACGLHAGGPAVMRRTVAAALRAGVAIGAHPGYADRAGFGRQAQALPPAEIHDLVLFQIGALDVFVRAAGARLQHVKPHGALYHEAAARPEVADAIAHATRAARADLVLVGAPDSALAVAARACGLRFAGELFADRQYGDDGRLLPRSDPRAFVTLDDAAAAARAVRMARDREIPCASGKVLAQAGQTICLHGDDPRAADRARALRAAFARAGLAVAPLGSWL
jgi:UPF0271 protein